MVKIALVVLDTLRKDAFDRHFDWLPGRRYENAWSTSHWTVPAHASLFTGQYASDCGVYARSQTLDCTSPVLAESLRDAGYRTHGLSANSHVVPHFDFDRGFEMFELLGTAKMTRHPTFPWDEHLSEATLPFPASAATAMAELLRSDYDAVLSFKKAYWELWRNHRQVPDIVETGVKQARRYVEEASSTDQEFLFLNLMEAHSPYRVPRKYQSMRYPPEALNPDPMANFTDEQPTIEGAKVAYEDSVRYLSDEYQRIFEALDEFDYVITLSDHGDLFGEDGLWQHTYGVRPELTHVPLVVSGPDRRSSTSTAAVNLLDVYHTVLDVADVAGADGDRSLCGDPDDRDCLTEYHGITHAGRFDRLRENGLSADRIDQFDEPRYGLATTPDYYGHQTIDGFEQEGSSLYDDPRGRLESLIEARRPIDRSETALDAGVQERLGDLGYI
jgi:arylsulfatase A-like enzyme